MQYTLDIVTVVSARFVTEEKVAVQAEAAVDGRERHTLYGALCGLVA